MSVAALRAEVVRLAGLAGAVTAMDTTQVGAVAEVRLSASGAQFVGRKDAPVTMVEFYDFECPFCRRFATGTLPHLLAKYVEVGKLRILLRDYPLTAMHPNALHAAEAARCAGEQGRYWEYHQLLMASPATLDSAHLMSHAQAAGLTLRKFRDCLDSGQQLAGIQQDLSEGAAAGVEGTPTFFFGVTESGTEVRATRALVGALPYESFRQVIDTLLATPR